jgi:23S rRNA (adenine2503-C2)-methyltransferase
MEQCDQTDLLSLTFEDLEIWLEEHNIERYRATQIYHWVYQKLTPTIESIQALPQELRTLLSEYFFLGTATVKAEQHAKDDRTRKILLTLHDNKLIESVLMLYPSYEKGKQGSLIHNKARATVCVSSQAGCAFGCTFCATGQMGFERHLQTGEIIYQTVHFARELAKMPWKAAELLYSKPINHITNIVMMGMGEPLHNYKNVIKALHILNDPRGFNLGARNITLSTVGVVPGIYKLIDEPLQINLAISLHAPTNTLRSSTMPVNKKYPIEDIITACHAYIAKKKRQITFEYVLLAGVNDTIEHAENLANLLTPLHQFAHVNCIPVNVTSAGYQPPTPESIHRFRQILQNAHISNSVRAERGDDIAAACGQLKTKEKNDRHYAA